MHGMDTEAKFSGMSVFHACNSFYYANGKGVFKFHVELFLHPFLICFVPFVPSPPFRLNNELSYTFISLRQHIYEHGVWHPCQYLKTTCLHERSVATICIIYTIVNCEAFIF
jgi:hypothetical protein